MTDKRSTYFIFILLNLIVFIIRAQPSENIKQQPWESIRQVGRGTLTIYWNETPPFISSKGDGKLEGIEHDLIIDFQKFLKTQYGVEIDLQWEKQTSFGEVYKRVQHKDDPSSFAASGFSITTARQNEVAFSPSYMADISVMISSEPVPIARNIEEFMKITTDLTAVTVRQSTFEADLLAFKKSGGLTYPIQYVNGGNEIVKEILRTPDAFGIIDLAIYLELIKKNPALKVKRQNLFTKVRKGFGIIYPLGTDWGVPLMEFFQQKDFKNNFQDIIARYINPDDYNFIEGLPDSDFQISILTREKEIQQQQLNEEVRIRDLGMTLLVITSLSLILILILFRRSKLLYKEINQQRKDIEKQNIELELKNKKLEEFMFTNAHKLRAPVATIIGLVQLYQYHHTYEITYIIEMLKKSSVKLDEEVKAIRSKLEEEGWSNQLNK